MDTNKLQGKIREQMNREIKARREFEQKWKFMKSSETNKFYSKSYLDEKVTEALGKAPDIKKENGGETFFVSPTMYDAMKLCRCGRKLSGTHIIKCMQKALIKYSENADEDEETTQKDEPTRDPNIPVTSNALNGFYKSKYWNLERSTNHVSTKSFLKHKITDQIYENIIIG